jgi:GT2 family glycosyltransferase
MKSLSIIIPNYNGQEILQQNLPVILAHAQKYKAPIIIVDDKSKDNSVAMLKEKFPQVILIEKPTNQGFSSTVNTGVKTAQTELVCLLNSDIVTTENFLDPLFAYFDDSQTAAVRPRIFALSRRRGRVTFWA